MSLVYRIDTYATKGNSHEIGGRHESWFLHHDRTFDSDEQARAYIRAQSRLNTNLPNLLISLPADKREEFVNDFCFGDGYWSERRYFLGYPPVNRIQEAIRASGVKLRADW